MGAQNDSPATDLYNSMSPMANKFINPDGTIQTLAQIIGGGGGGSTAWGQITGNITNQIDLSDALDSKANISSVPTVVQTTGTSTTNVMSQNAVTDLVSSFTAERYEVDITTPWTKTGDMYTKTTAVTGIKEENNYVCSIITSPIEATATAQKEAYSQVNEIEIEDDLITLTAFPPAPATDFKLLVMK
jgi:hypothetical protein